MAMLCPSCMALLFAGYFTIATSSQDSGRTAKFLQADPVVTDGTSPAPDYDFYHKTMIPLFVVTLMLAWWTRPKSGSEPLPSDFLEHQWKYIVVWGPAVMADWFQGPYVYALYASYGYSSADIAQLFVAGFGASMVIGTVVGSVADACGRKRCAVLYCVLYALSCLTKHSSSYSVLMVGRITGGVATSLLFSTFECWMVADSQRRGFSSGLLRYMFGVMFFVMYLTAIVAGVLAQAAADSMPLTSVPGFETLHYGGYTAPFDLSLVFLLGTIPMICFLWEENYGEQGAGVSVGQSLVTAIRTLRSSWRMCAIGALVACFEGSMYAFVFNWTPALESDVVPPPYGLIFSAFMMTCMCGASLFGLFDSTVAPSKILLPVFILAATALYLSNTFVGTSHVGIIFVGFLLFEFCVGVYFPAMGSLKSEVVPEEARAGVYNIFRIPLNAVVVGLLLTHLSTQTALGICVLLLSLSALVIIPLMWHGSKAACGIKGK